MTIEISGQTIYELDQDGVNRWSANIQPGIGLDGYRQPDSVIDRVAKRLYIADLYHEKIVEALLDMLDDANDNGYESICTEKARVLLSELENQQ